MAKDDYSDERSLGKFAALSPAEQARSDAFEARPEVRAELDSEIARQKDPKARAILTAYRDGTPEPLTLAQAKTPKASFSSGLDSVLSEGTPTKRRSFSEGLDAVLNDDTQYPAPKRTTRTWGEATTDTLKGMAAGVGSTIEGLGDAGGLVSGKMQNPVSEFGKSVRNYWEEDQSDVLKGKKRNLQANIDAQEGMFGKAWEAVKGTATDPALAADAVASNVATMIPGVAMGRVAAGSKMASGVAAASELGPASLVAREAAAKAAGRFGTNVAIGTGAVQQGADISGDVYEAALKKPDTVWLANPEFMERLRNQNDRSLEAIQALKEEFALKAARATFPGAAGISLAANKVIPHASALERVLVGAPQKLGKETASFGLTKAVGKAALGGGTEEVAEEAGGAWWGNLMKREIADPTQDLTEGVGEAGGRALVPGALMGGLGGLAYRRSEVQTQLDDLNQNSLKSQTDQIASKYQSQKDATDNLRKAGDTVGADALQKAANKRVNAELADVELAGLQQADAGELSGSPSFQNQYKEHRVAGMTPSEAAARAAVVGKFIKEAVTGGIPEDAIARAVTIAKTKPMDEVPAFLNRFATALRNKGLGQVAEIEKALTDTSEQAMMTVATGIYGRMSLEEQHGRQLQKLADDMDAEYLQTKLAGRKEAKAEAAQAVAERANGQLDDISPTAGEPAPTGGLDDIPSVVSGNTDGIESGAEQGRLAADNVGESGELPVGTDAAPLTKEENGPQTDQTIEAKAQRQEAGNPPEGVAQPDEARQEPVEAPAKPRPEVLIELRKQHAVLKALLKCLG